MDEENTKHLPNLPKKLAQRFEKRPNGVIVKKTAAGKEAIELKSEHPVSVVEYFLAVHIDKWAVSTYSDYSYDLTRFLEFCEYANIDDLSTVSSRTFVEFKEWRNLDGNIGLATLHGQLGNIRPFVRWCEGKEIVEEGVADSIVMPDLDPSDIVSYTRLEPETAEQILEYHGKLDYVTRAFAMFALMWSVLVRLGGLRSLDLDNYHPEEGYIELEHDPEEDTPLKNGASEVEGVGGEREINIPDWVCEILDTYIDGTGDPNHPKRIDAEDEYGRKPLFSSRMGRVSPSTIRRDLYRITQPCRHGNGCPHDKDPDSCEARNDNNLLSKCPSNVSPHPVRRGGICHQLIEGVPKDTICERADVSRRVLNQHYDLRTKEEARQQRRDELRKHLDGFEDPNKDPATESSFIQREIPLAVDTTAAIRGLSSNRIMKGIAGYCAFVMLAGFNLGLLGLGFDPIAWEFVIDLW